MGWLREGAWGVKGRGNRHGRQCTAAQLASLAVRGAAVQGAGW